VKSTSWVFILAGDKEPVTEKQVYTRESKLEELMKNESHHDSHSMLKTNPKNYDS
jgi:hypothetical protein